MEITSGLWLQLVSPGLTQIITISNRLLVQFLCHYFYYFVLFWLIFWISSWENWFVTIHSLVNVYSKADSFSWRWSFVSKFIFALWLDILNYLEHLCFSLVFSYFKRIVFSCSTETLREPSMVWADLLAYCFDCCNGQVSFLQHLYCIFQWKTTPKICYFSYLSNESFTVTCTLSLNISSS